MEHVVKTLILSANTAKPQREEQLYRAPCKTQRKRELKKQMLNASVTPKLKNTMEHVVKIRIWSANAAKPQREQQFYRGPL